MEYDFVKPWETLDEWQKKILETDGNIVLRSGRQVGKSTIISVKAGEFALKNKNKTILIVASVERQAQLLFEKVLAYIYSQNKNAIKIGKERPTRHKLELKNGSKILCLPTGESGYGIRGFTIDLLIADEAAFIPEEVWTAVTPMLAVTRGNIWLLSTPFGRGGFFYRCFQDENFKSFHVSSEECPRRNQTFLDHEKKRMTKAQYAQEYLGEFVDELRQFLPDKLIINAQILKRRERIIPNRAYFLGVDVARMGEDESTFEIIDRTDRENPVHVESIITTHTLTTDTARLIILLESQYHFKQIFVDDGGMGVGVLDMLLENQSTKRKVTAINNSDRPLDREEKHRKHLIKEDIYNNFLNLLETEKLKLLDDDEIFLSLKSVQYEYTDNGMLKIFGNYTHIADGLVRAAYCVKDKSLNIYAY